MMIRASGASVKITPVVDTKIMNKKCKCERCGADVEMVWEAPYQEYAGGKVWGGEGYAGCEADGCGWFKFTKDLSNYTIQEFPRHLR